MHMCCRIWEGCPAAIYCRVTCCKHCASRHAYVTAQQLNSTAASSNRGGGRHASAAAASAGQRAGSLRHQLAFDEKNSVKCRARPVCGTRVPAKSERPRGSCSRPLFALYRHVLPRTRMLMQRRARPGHASFAGSEHRRRSSSVCASNCNDDDAQPAAPPRQQPASHAQDGSTVACSVAGCSASRPPLSSRTR